MYLVIILLNLKTKLLFFNEFIIMQIFHGLTCSFTHYNNISHQKIGEYNGKDRAIETRQSL